MEPETQKTDGWVDVEPKEQFISTADPLAIHDTAGWEDIPDETPSEQRESVISKVARMSLKDTPIEMVKTGFYVLNAISKDDSLRPQPNEMLWDYDKRIQDTVIVPREKEIVSEGIGKVLETPMQAGLVAGLIAAPAHTAVAVAGFTGLDYLFNLRRMTEHSFPNTAPELLDIIEIGDFAIKGGIVGGALRGGKSLLNNLSRGVGVPQNVNVKPSDASKITDSFNLLDKEKADALSTLGISNAHLEASKAKNLPINIPTENVYALTEKPYWEIVRAELLGDLPVFEGPTPKPMRSTQETIARVKTLQKEKNLSNITVSKLKKFIGIENIKKSDEARVKKLAEFLDDLKPEDKLLSEKQALGLKELIDDLPNPEITPKRIVVDKFGDKEQILSGAIVSKLDPNLIPTVDIKSGHPLIAKIADKIQAAMTKADKNVNKINEEVDVLITKAEKSRAKLLDANERTIRQLVPQNKEIFRALSGERVDLTKEEAAAVSYLKSFFERAGKDARLEKYRKNYITHMEKQLLEKVAERGLINGIRDVLAGQKKGDMPADILIELENIIGSEKFFKYSLERKGGIDPTTDVRRIVAEYSNLVETKKALDGVLPEGQAVVQLLLNGKSAVWEKQFLQNLKGRGLDFQFRSGPMGWLSRVADGIVDVGYIKLLGFNWKTPISNVLSAEVNSWIYQDFPTYLLGKKRFLSNPKRAYALAKEYGALDGTYADYAQKGIGSLKKLQDLSMVGIRAGEVEARASIFVSRLSEAEWKNGAIDAKNVSKIMDEIAITQGLFTKWDTPLLLQTWYGRMFAQMNRWRITNAMMLRRIIPAAISDMKEGNFNTHNVSRLGKTIFAYGVGMYIASELTKAGYTQAGRITKNMAHTIDGMVSLITEGQLIKMFTDNPSLRFLKEVSNTIQNTAEYMNYPGAQEARGRGVEDTYIASFDLIGSIADEIEENM